MDTPLILCENLVKIYKVADLEVVALQGLDLEIASGEMVAMMGASGSGKSTLLNVLSGLDMPSAGRCLIAGYDVLQLTPAQRLNYRRRVIGYVWQQSGRNLIAHYTLAQNLAVPQLACGIPATERRRRADEILEAVGLGDKANKYPSQLSGGEQQRVGIAVAVVHHPAILLADEPTGELDSATAEQILQLIRQMRELFHLTVLLVTHDPVVARKADRVIALRDGRTSTETRWRSGMNDDVQAFDGTDTTAHDELVVVDRVGRLQLPRDIMDALAIRGLVKVHLTADHAELWPFHEKADQEGV